MEESKIVIAVLFVIVKIYKYIFCIESFKMFEDNIPEMYNDSKEYIMNFSRT